MRKLAMGLAALLCMSSMAETLTVAQDYAVDSDVALESVVREIKSAPRDTVNVVGDAIKYVADETATAVNGVKAVFKSNPIDKVEKDGMLEVANAWDSSNDIVFRSYKVSEAVGEELVAGASGAEGEVVDVSPAFYGIDFPKNASAYFRPEFNRLFIRNTLSNIFAIEDVLAELHSAERDLMGKQVSIEAKFVEVNQSTLEELGFDWTFTGKKDNKTGNDSWNVADDLYLPSPQDLFSAGLRAGTQALNSGVPSDYLLLQRVGGSLNWDLVISALEQDTDTDVLSAPHVVTRDGSTASILVGEERTISSGFDVKNSESSLFIEHDLEIDNTGVMLEVTPELRSDSLIDLELNPKVIDLIGYDNYQVHPAAIAVGYNGVRNTALPDTFELPALKARMPYYRLREMETQATVADGSTVAMGGLIYDKLETFRDKVPVLGSIPLVGRLFRSEGEKSIKRNLIIFVTATQVDVNGRTTADLALKK